MELHANEQGQVAVVTLTGSIDSPAAEDVSRFLNTLLAKGSRRIVLDLAGVDYVSSAGLWALRAAVNAARAQHGDLRLAAVQPGALRVLELSGLTDSVNLFPDTAAAVASFAAGPTSAAEYGVFEVHVERAGLGRLPEIKAFIEQSCRRAGLSDATATAISLAVDECCTNVLTHGYRRGAPGPLTVEVCSSAADVAVAIVDHGRPFRSESDPAADPNGTTSRATGGLALHLARRVMDEVRYEVDGATGNRLTLVKRRQPAG